MERVTIQKLNAHGAVVVAYAGVIVAHVPGGVQVEARWERPALDLGYTRFAPGDRFVEWFYRDRWYNIFEVHAAASDALKGWYCNLAAPARIELEEQRVIACQDLLLDLWVAADGSTWLLDEEEFAAAVELGELGPALCAGVERGLAELRALVAARLPPFDAIVAASEE